MSAVGWIFAVIGWVLIALSGFCFLGMLAKLLWILLREGWETIPTPRTRAERIAALEQEVGR